MAANDVTAFKLCPRHVCYFQVIFIEIVIAIAIIVDVAYFSITTTITKMTTGNMHNLQNGLIFQFILAGIDINSKI